MLKTQLDAAAKVTEAACGGVTACMHSLLVPWEPGAVGDYVQRNYSATLELLHSKEQFMQSFINKRYGTGLSVMSWLSPTNTSPVKLGRV